MKIGQAIKKLRKERLPKLGQFEFAKQIGITQSYLSQIEKGRKKPSMDIIEKIANYFEVPVPIMFWFSVEESDIRPELRQYYHILKPNIDSLIESIY